MKRHQWLKCAGLKVDTETCVMATQDQRLFKNSKASMIHNCAVPLCRLYESHIEAVVNVMPSCPILIEKACNFHVIKLCSLFNEDMSIL